MSQLESSTPQVAAPSSPPTSPPTNVRLWVIVGLALASTCAYLTRNSLGTVNTTIQGELHLDPAVMGVVMSAFFAGYFWFQIPGGILANRWGTRRVLPLLCLAWSACGAWTALATSADSLKLSRFISGIAQAGLVPCSAKAVRDWVPPAQTGLASSAVAGSMTLGGVIAAGLTAQLMPQLGWRGVFFLYSALGLLWALMFYAGFRNRPEEHPKVNEAELHVIRAGAAPKPAVAVVDEKDKPMRVLAAMAISSTLWLLCLQAFCRAFGAVFFSTWFPAYLEQGRGVSVVTAGSLSMWPQVGILVGNLLGGVLVDRILVRSRSKWVSRCATSALALALCAVALLAATVISDARLAVWVIALGCICFGCGSPAGWAAQMDVSGKHTATVFAIANMAGNFGAWICPILLGQTIQSIKLGHTSWSMLLYIIAGIYLLGAIFWVLINPHRSAVGQGLIPEAASA
jgi:sugar phosphate permease